MATTEGILTLINNNYHVYPKIQMVCKNTVNMTGLCFYEDGQHIAPVIYIDRFLCDEFTDEEAASYVMTTYNQAGIDIDIDLFKDANYIREHLYLGLEKKGDDNKYLTRDSAYENIIEYLYIRDEASLDNTFSVKISAEHLKSVGISEAEAWNIASEHTAREIQIQTMSEVLHDMMPDNIEQIDDVGMYIFSNHIRMRGAAVVTNLDYVKRWAKDKGFNKIIIIFSSIHEVIVLPATDDTDIDAITEMIQEVNKGCVEPAEQLAEKAYIISTN